MTIGKLNDLLDGLSCRVSFEGSTLAPSMETEGDPLYGGRILIKWQDARDADIELLLELPCPCFIDRAVLRIGEKTGLAAVTLKAETGRLSEHHAESGKRISERTIELVANAVCDRLALSLCGDFSDIEVEGIDLYGALLDAPIVFPTPNEEHFGEDLLPHAHFSSYTADSDAGRRAGEILAEKFFERTGVTVTESENGVISFVTDDGVAADGYELRIGREATEIRASNLRGFVLGAECFMKLTGDDGVCTAEISDAPAYPFRGVHLYLPAIGQMEFMRRIVKYLISPMGYNAIIIEVATGMEYHSHPEINAAVADALEKHRQGLWPAFPHAAVADGTVVDHETIKAFVAYIRSFGIEVIPEVQSLGHVPYLTLAHPEIAEVAEDHGDSIDTRAEDARPTVFYPHCYCPSNERSYELLFDLLDEVIEVFEPREYVHMGHDEVYYMGLCPKCRERSHAELYAEDVNRIYAHLKEKGLKMMIWADMLQPVTKYQTPPAIHMIPKDIVMLDFIWYFHLGKDIETNLLDEGFKVAIGNLYSSHFPRFESRIRREGMIGGQISMWSSSSEKGLQKEGKLYDIFMTAEMLWAERYTHHLSIVYELMIAARMPYLREELRGVRYPSLARDAELTTLYEAPIASLSAMEPLKPSEILVDDHYDSIVIAHTLWRRYSRLPWSENDVLGFYTLRYDDGTEERVDITKNGNIGYRYRRHGEPLRHPLYRHNGYTSVYETDGEVVLATDGTSVTLYRYEHLLPKGKTLRSITLTEDPAFDEGICLFRVEGVRKG